MAISGGISTGASGPTSGPRPKTLLRAFHPEEAALRGRSKRAGFAGRGAGVAADSAGGEGGDSGGLSAPNSAARLFQWLDRSVIVLSSGERLIYDAAIGRKIASAAGAAEAVGRDDKRPPV